MEETIVFVEHNEPQLTDQPHCSDCFGMVDTAHCGECSPQSQPTEVTDTAHCGGCF